ncbi:MAG: hypothetical protein RJB38_1557 [Pseudomonadota bacterium]|jgi:F0F1-type ATP synthase membrane subunit c/vacuolar-type H+-ATPase subunit K
MAVFRIAVIATATGLTGSAAVYSLARNPEAHEYVPGFLEMVETATEKQHPVDLRASD